MKLVTEGQIETNENLLTGCSADDAALINSDPNLNDQQRFEAMMNPEAYKFRLNNPYIIKDVQNYPALFRNLADPNDYIISRAYQAEFEKYENRLSQIARTQTPFENAWNSFRVTQEEMRKGDLNAQRMDAIKDNDDEKVKELDKKIQEKQAEIDSLAHPSRQGFSGTFGSITASIGRELPEMVATGIATSILGAAAGPTGGATAPAAAVTAGRFARALMRIKKAYTAYKATKTGIKIAKTAPYINNVINASVIYNDTTNVARGQMYEQLSKAHPEWSEDILQDLSWSQARYQGLLEAGTSFVGVTARGGKAIYNIAGKAALMKKGVASIEAAAVSDIEKEAAKKAFSNLVESGLIKPELARNNTFLRSTINKVMELREKRLVKGIEFGADMALEGATEVYQNAIEDVVKNMTLDQVGSVNVLGAAHEEIKGYVGEMYDYIVTGKEMSPDAQEAWDTFKNVAIGSAVLGGAFTGIDATSKRIFRSKSQSVGEQLDAANKTVQTFDTVLEQKGNSKVGEKSPTTLNNFYKNAIKSGEIPETLYMRLDKLKEIITKMKDDPVAMAKLNAMKVGEKMAEAENDGGLVEFDSADFIENIVDPKNDTLYQTIKGDISANPALNSQNDIFELIENIGKSDAMIKVAQEDPNSIFNKVLENQTKAGSDEKLAKVNAIIAQSMFNTFQRMRNDKATMEQIINQIGLRIENVDTIQPGTGELNQYTGTKSATALVQQLSAAQVMEQKNVSMTQILKDTGWFRDPADNQWKFEISDKDAKINEAMLEKIFSNKKKDATLSDVLEHDKLFAAYPFLANMPVKYNSHIKTYLGALVPDGKGWFYIEVAKTNDFYSLRDTLLHEIAHAIQAIEGFGRGGNIKGKSNIPDDLMRSYIERQRLQNVLWKELSKNGIKPARDVDLTKRSISHPSFMDAMPHFEKIAEKDQEVKVLLDRVKELNERLAKVDARSPRLKYLMLSGENEARDVEARSEMTDKERAETLPANLAGVRAPTVKFIIEGETTEIPAQENPVAQIAGSIEFGAETIIRLSKISNPTTFSHEMAHLFGRQLFGAYNAGLLTERWTKNTDKLAEFLEIEKDEYGQYQFAGNTAAEEKLAEAFTSYLETGKAPAPYLKELFDLIKEWFSNVYRMLKMANVPLDRKVTKVFDEIFVPYEKQKQILLERRYGFIAKPADMTDDQYERYIAAKRAAASRGQTIDTKLAAKMHEIVSNETYKAEYEAAYRQAFEDLGTLPVYQMIDYVIQEKISRASLDKVSKDIKLPRQYVSTKDGLDITQVYAQFTDLVNSPEEMANMLSETPSRESAAEYAANEHMKEWLQENYPEVAEMDSELASRNEQVFKLAVMEYMMLSGIGMERFNQIHNDMLSVAEYMVQRMPLKKIANVQRWIEQESKLMQKYDYTLTDKQKAQIKRQQAFLNYYAMRAKQIRQEAQKFIRKSKKYRGPQTKDVLKTIDGETFDLLKSMLNKFKLSNSKPNTNVPMGTRIDNWVEMMSNNNYSAANEISRYKTALVNGVESKLTTADFELLKEAFEFVEACGNKLKTIQVGEKTIMVENAAQAIADAFAQAGIKPREKELGIAVMREAVMRELFPTQVFLDFVSPVFKGLTRKDMQIQKWRNELADILKPFGKDLQKKMTIDGHSYTIEQLLVMMLNSGNQHNINCMVKTMQTKMQNPDFNEDALFSILEQSPKYLREATRKIWKIFEDNKQAFQEAQTKIDGKVLRFVEAQPYTFSDGEKMQGGYYPAGKVSVINDYENSQTKFDNSGTYATKSFQKERSYAHDDLDLTLNTLGSWFYKMAGVLHVAVPYNNMGKLLKNQTFRNAVGEGMVKSLSEWLQLSVAPERVNQILSAVNQFVSVGTLGLKWVKTFTQMSGMIPSMAEVGPGYVARAAATTNPIKAIENASKLSEYMFARYAHPEDHLQLYMRTNNLFGESISKLNNIQFEKVMNFAMIFTIYGDAIASTVTWKAEYAKQIDAGRTHNQAVELADSAVRRLQGDSSAGSRPPILQGDKRFFTMFASYFIGIHSMLVAHKISGDKVKMAALLFAAAVAAPMFEAIFSTANDWIGADDDDKKKFKKEGIESIMDLYLKQSIGNVASSAGAFWLPQFGVGSTLGTAVVTGKVYSPRNMQIEYMLKPIEIGTDLIQAAKLSSQGKNKKAEQKLKNGLKKIFEFGMINSSVSDRLSNLLIGE